MTAIVGIILGMGLPTTGVYVILASLAAPALVQLGVLPMAAHMYVFYYGVIAVITPPVALASYAAASIAGSKPGQTGWFAVKLGLAGSCNWYTDQSIKCMYPELGRTVGYVVTVVYELPDPEFQRLSLSDVLYAIEASPKPCILVMKQNIPDEIKRKNGLSGGNMTTAFQTLGCVGCVSDGPSRDLECGMGIQEAIVPFAQVKRSSVHLSNISGRTSFGSFRSLT
ncbi:hypothetical protein AGMMS50276_28810 [Synergistales bacterium]|nr:hypothetical protein AGMMS50276_28810 [Synergistales bacterium]